MTDSRQNYDHKFITNANATDALFVQNPIASARVRVTRDKPQVNRFSLCPKSSPIVPFRSSIITPFPQRTGTRTLLLIAPYLHTHFLPSTAVASHLLRTDY
jgi:hypothetical protein